MKSQSRIPLLGIFAFAAFSFHIEASEGTLTQTVIHSDHPAERWEDGMVSGNGATGIMVFGNPHDETIIVNHEKCWVPTSDVALKVPNLQEPIQYARERAKKGKFGWTELKLYNDFSNWNLANYPSEDLRTSFFGVAAVAGKDKVHPALQIRWIADARDDIAISNYSRETVLDTGEVNVHWSDPSGNWERSAFVSRPDDLIVWRMIAPQNGKLDGVISLEEVLDKKVEGDLKSVKIEYSNDGFYFFASYGRTNGEPIREGYHTAGKIICKGGKSIRDDAGVRIEGASEVLILSKFEFLMDVSKASASELHRSIQTVDGSYETLNQRHAAIHGEMLRRVQVDFGGNHGDGRSIEALLEEGSKVGMTPELMELLHDVGRYALISSSGDFPPALMGIWSGDWNPPWTGHYTFDSNLQLAISAASSGALPEAIDSYVNLMETMFPAWETNARELHGCRGYHASMGSSWRVKSGLNGSQWFAMTGAVAWLTSYYHEYYLCSGDESFLLEKEIPILKKLALFYEDYLEGAEDESGRYLFYPSISPESIPDKLPNTDLRTYTAPNATSEIAQCRFVFTTLIEECSKRGIESNNLSKWKEILGKLPDYWINEDGALHEWSYRGVEASYTNKHCSQFFPIYPGLEADEFERPELFQSIKRGMEMRAKQEADSNSGHSILHDCFFSARLKDSDTFWKRINLFAQHEFFYTSLLSAHYPNQGVYNLDTTLALPAVFMEMLVKSQPKSIELLPVLDFDRIPKGEIRGMLIKCGLKIDRLAWDVENGSVRLEVSASETKMLQLSSPHTIEQIRSDHGSVQISESDRGKNWRQIRFPKGTSSLDIVFKRVK